MSGKRIGFGDEVTAGMAKDVKDTRMLDTTAREPASTVSGDNPQKRYTTKHKPFGKLGAKGQP
jgi:hypothetical protein